MTRDEMIEVIARAADPTGWRWYDAADDDHPAKPIFRQDQLKRMAAALAAHERLTGWQPIEEAPLNGTTFLAYVPDGVSWRSIASAPRDGTWIELTGPSGSWISEAPYRVSLCRWFIGMEEWRDHVNDRYTRTSPEPTHWRPWEAPR